MTVYHLVEVKWLTWKKMRRAISYKTQQLILKFSAISCQYMRFERYTDDTKAFKYLTGLDGHEHFKLIFTILGPACYELNYQSKQLSPENELFLTLVKLCHVLDHL